jgi:cobalamin biosynthesis Co2+ chelatase CbiK
LPLGFLFALFVGLALARSYSVKGAALRLHPYVGVAGEHGARDVASDTHNHFVAGT